MRLPSMHGSFHFWLDPTTLIGCNFTDVKDVGYVIVSSAQFRLYEHFLIFFKTRTMISLTIVRITFIVLVAPV